MGYRPVGTVKRYQPQSWHEIGQTSTEYRYDIRFYAMVGSLHYDCDHGFLPLDFSFISILQGKYESPRPLKHIHLVANCDITLIHQKTECSQSEF